MNRPTDEQLQKIGLAAVCAFSQPDSITKGHIAAGRAAFEASLQLILNAAEEWRKKPSHYHVDYFIDDLRALLAPTVDKAVEAVRSHIYRIPGVSQAGAKEYAIAIVAAVRAADKEQA